VERDWGWKAESEENSWVSWVKEAAMSSTLSRRVERGAKERWCSKVGDKRRNHVVLSVSARCALSRRGRRARSSCGEENCERGIRVSDNNGERKEGHIDDPRILFHALLLEIWGSKKQRSTRRHCNRSVAKKQALLNSTTTDTAICTRTTGSTERQKKDVEVYWKDWDTGKWRQKKEKNDEMK
jgi:hypothetical protein